MSDNNTSGASSENAETPKAPAVEQGAASFGTSRGSGLSRGKRSTPPAAGNNAGQPSENYKPSSSVQVVSSKSEYRNPFAPAEEAAANTEVAEAPAEAQQAAVETPAPAAAETSAETPAPAEQTEQAAVTEQPAEKTELNILPPAEDTRKAQSWETSHGTREERKVFRPEPRSTESKRPEGKRAEDLKLGGESARRRERREMVREIENQHKSEKPEGFFKWLKNLFFGAKKPAKKEEQRDGDANRGRDGNRRRRHRGGRGGYGRGEGRGGDRRRGGEGGGQQRGYRGGQGGSHSGPYRHRDRGGRGHRRDGGHGHSGGGE